MKWRELLNRTRPGREDEPGISGDLRNAFEKDHHRIITSASFRRLQDKTQVFPLDKSDFIRTRLTHSLEVSSVGRALAGNITSLIEESGREKNFGPDEREEICDVLQCAGLIHDIGNPPFGHFGEETIREWFRENLKDLKYKGKDIENVLTPQQLADFKGFEGNAQGLRMVTRLDYPIHNDGMNLTYGLLSAVIKYPVSSLEADPADKRAARRKMGYFASEADIFRKITDTTGTYGKRNPMAVILEAADDIAYATADIEDAFKKGFFDYSTFFRELTLRNVAKDMRIRLTDIYDMARLASMSGPEEYAIRSWLREMQDVLIDAAGADFMDHYDAIMDGTWAEPLITGKRAGKLLAALKGIAYDYAFTSMSIFKTEIAANHILNYLLGNLVPACLRFGEKDPGLMEEKYLSLIPENYREVCLRAIAGGDEADEAYAKIQMACDTLSGMTDSYARDLYSELTGI